MVSAENRTGLYVSIPLYFFVLALSGVWAYRKVGKMTADGTTDHLSGHYLGGRAFGPIMTAGTVFASLYSGYTVVGIPNEAFKTGFQAFRWLPATACMLGGYVGTGTRLRKAHGSKSPNASGFHLVSAIIYLAAQVASLKSTFNSMFELSPNTAWPVIVMMILILMFEWMGGLSCVAITDSVQGFVMMCSFIMLPCVIVKNFGGWSSLDVETYPRPDFYQTPTKDEQWLFWQFSMLLTSFFTLPHLVQRIYAARDLHSLRFSWAFLSISPWVAMFVGIFLGTMGVQILADAGITNPASPFTAILEEVMNLGGFGRFVGVIAFTASLAAIMSTADSLLIAVSQLITIELVYPTRPASKPSQVAWHGRIVSLFTTAFALIIGIMWKEGISDLAAINFPVAIQAVPTFVVGLYASEKWDMHPWSLASASILATVYVFAIYFGYINTAGKHLPIDAGMTGILINLVLICLFELGYHHLVWKKRVKDKSTPSKRGFAATGERKLIFPDRPTWDVPKLNRFGEHTLTPRLLDKMMAGVGEPMRNIWFVLFFFFSVTVCTPLVSENQPPMDPETGLFVSAPATINGLPWWYFKQIMLCFIPYIMLLSMVWQTPSAFPTDEDEIQKHGINLDLIEYTHSEMVRRTSYDETNVLYNRRRSTIKSQMEELGMKIQEEDQEDDEDDDAAEEAVLDKAPAANERRLSALVLGKIEMPLDDDSEDPVLDKEKDDNQSHTKDKENDEDHSEHI